MRAAPAFDEENNSDKLFSSIILAEGHEEAQHRNVIRMPRPSLTGKELSIRRHVMGNHPEKPLGGRAR